MIVYNMDAVMHYLCCKPLKQNKQTNFKNFKNTNKGYNPFKTQHYIIHHLKFELTRHLGVVVDIDNIYGPVSVTDEEDGVIVRLQHLKEIDIRSTVDENKVPKLQNRKTQNETTLRYDKG